METSSVRCDSIKKWFPFRLTARNRPVDSWRQASTFSIVVAGSLHPMNAVSGHVSGARAEYRYEFSSCKSARNARITTSRISGCDSDVSRLPYRWFSNCSNSESSRSDVLPAWCVKPPGQGCPDTKRCTNELGEDCCKYRARSNPMTAPRLWPKMTVGNAGSADTASISACRIAPQSVNGVSAILFSRPGSCTANASTCGGSSFAQGRKLTIPAPAYGMHSSRTRAIGCATRLFSRIIVAAGAEGSSTSAIDCTDQRNNLLGMVSMLRSENRFGSVLVGIQE